MADNCPIEWLQRPGTKGASWNCVVGCSKVSAGCANCYPVPIIHNRLSRNHKTPQYQGLTVLQGSRVQWSGEVRFIEEKLEVPMHWRTPRTVFVNSMSDLFHDKLRDYQIDKVFAVMAACPQHTFMVLTKRPQRALRYLRSLGTQAQAAERLSWTDDEDNAYSDDYSCRVANAINDNLGEGDNVGWPLRNLWLGVSVEDQAAADERIPLLLETPAAVRWISAEPLLGPVNLCDTLKVIPVMSASLNANTGAIGRAALRWEQSYNVHTREVIPPRLDWVVAGGESGPGARPMHPDWARSLRDQCAAAGVPFFFKQWGAWAPQQFVDGQQKPMLCISLPSQKSFKPSHDRIVWHPEHGEEPLNMARVGKKAAGRLLDGRLHDEYPALQTSAEVPA